MFSLKTMKTAKTISTNKNSVSFDVCIVLILFYCCD